MLEKQVIDFIEEDSDGVWIYLNRGYQFDDVHSIHEDTVKAAKSLLPLVKPCFCRDCNKGEN